MYDASLLKWRLKHLRQVCKLRHSPLRCQSNRKSMFEDSSVRVTTKRIFHRQSWL